MQITIRKATKADIPSIHRLVYELAEYEKAADQMTASIETYEMDFDAGWFETLVAETDKKETIGIALYYKTYSTWRGRMVYLEDFVVQKDWRRHGVGQLLFDAFVAEAKKTGAKIVKWQVLDWNEPAIKFYKKNDAIIEQEWWNGKIFLESFEK